MRINREIYLQALIDRMHNGMIKVITGIRRCGKSYLLFEIFRDYLKSTGVDDSHIIAIELDKRQNMKYHDPDMILEFIESQITKKGIYYVFLDEVQLLDEFESVLNSLLHISNVDVYVTGSNSKFLSKDVITEFRGRGDEIRVHPLSFREFADFHQGDMVDLLNEYMLYGGLPQVVLETDAEKKKSYLLQQFTHTYLRDIRERYTILNDDDLSELVSTLASSIGCMTNPSKLVNTFHSVKKSSISFETVAKYLSYLEDAFMIERSIRYDIKGRKYIDTPYKFYFEDLGLRNARIGFRQYEEGHLMENLIYNELRMLGYTVDVGQVVVEQKDEDGKRKRQTFEVDFVCNKGYSRVYIQSAYKLQNEDKYRQEINSLTRLSDGFRRVVISGMLEPTHMDDKGIYFVNVYDFLRNPAAYIDN